MYVDELMIQKEHVDKMICAIENRYEYKSAGYRIEQKAEHDITGVCGLYSPDTDNRLLGTEEDMRMLCFLLHEKKCMMEAILKCQKENNKNIIEMYEDMFSCQRASTAKKLIDGMAMLYRKLPVRKQLQKAEGGYDMIVTQSSRIDKALLDALYHKCSRDYESFQRNKKECGRVEIDYEPAIDYTQYDGLNLRECLCKLEKKGVTAEWKS